MAGEGAVLRAKIALAQPALDIASSRVWLEADSATYARYLSAMYPVTRAAVPLMRFARDRCLRRPADPVGRALIVYLTRHIHAERGHHRWVAADLAALGHDPATVARALPPTAVTALIGAQYQLIAAVHPVTLLGCLAVLEGAPPRQALLDHVRALTGEGPTTTLDRHAASDARHAPAIFALLDRLTLDERLRAGLGFSALYTARQAIALLDELGAGAAADTTVTGLSELEAALVAEIESALTHLPDVVAHSSDIVGGLFL
jgi:hypothetical protein